ncbi:MAG: hypothetical protein GF397_02400 [Elusimicrobia bacterium]|nr:hypothetical protein [Elusimicrobiota bacterium]
MLSAWGTMLEDITEENLNSPAANIEIKDTKAQVTYTQETKLPNGNTEKSVRTMSLKKVENLGWIFAKISGL